MSDTLCALCGDPVDGPVRHIYFRVSGWERYRDAGGTNALRCRERTGEVAHALCVDREARNIDARQGRLL